MPNSSSAEQLHAPTSILKQSKAVSELNLEGIKISKDNPFEFEFLFKRGEKQISKAEFEKDAKRLIRYFLAILTMPEEDLWVNLSPYEEDRVINEKLRDTELGAELLAQDYILKQLSSSLTNPNTDLGRSYWDANLKDGSESYSKIWISPDVAEISIQDNAVYINKALLKLQSEKDYFAYKANNAVVDEKQELKAIMSVLKKEVNEREHFKSLRQIYNCFILASWFKKDYLNSVFKRYQDSSKTVGIFENNIEFKNKVFDYYSKSFDMGVYNLNKRVDGKQKNYFSGGVVLSSAVIDNVGSEGSQKPEITDRVNVLFTPLQMTAYKEPSLFDIDFGKKESEYFQAAKEHGPEVANARYDKRLQRPAVLRTLAWFRNNVIKFNIDKLDSKEEFNFYVKEQAANGVMGMAVLTAQSMIAENPNIHVNVYVPKFMSKKVISLFVSNERERLKIVPVSFWSWNFRPSIVSKKIDAVFTAYSSHYTNERRFKDSVIVEPPALAYDKAHENPDMASSQSISTDLAHNYGTIIYDKGLERKRLERDKWTKSEFVNARKSWLDKYGSKALDNLSSKQGWNPLDSIWSFAYVQEAAPLKRYLKILLEKANDATIAEKWFADGSEQVLINMVMGVVLEDSDFLQWIENNGINLIHNGSQVFGGGSKLTINIVDRIENTDLRELVASLNGTVSKVDGRFVDFPISVTGTSSFYEGLSDGSIVLHDGFDADTSKLKQLRSLVKMYFNLLDIDLNEDSKQVKDMADNLLMSSFNPDKFDDLAAWTKESREFSTQMSKLSMSKDLIIKRLQEKNSSSIVVEDEVIESLSEIEKDIDLYKEHIQVQRLEERKSSDHYLLELIRNRSLNKALNKQKLEKDEEFAFYIKDQALYGVMGTAVLLARSMIADNPGFKVKIYINQDWGLSTLNTFRGVLGDNISIKSVTKWRWETDEYKDKKIDVVFTANREEHLDLQRYDDSVIIPPYSYSYGRINEADSISELRRVNNDLADLNGTLILDQSLKQRREHVDSLSVEVIKDRRKQWMADFDTQPLESLAEENNWSITDSIWSFAYIQKFDQFQRVLSMMLELTKESEFRNKWFEKEGKQILVHTVLGKLLSSRHFLSWAKENQISLVSENEIIFKGNSSLTLFLHERLGNDKVTSLMADMSGTLKKDLNGAYVNYPVMITGSGSWFEALSARIPNFHDGNDAQIEKRDQVQSLIQRVSILEGNKYSAELVGPYKQQLDEQFMATVSKESLYDLAALSSKAKLFSEHMFKFNMADDIINKRVKELKQSSSLDGGINLELGEEIFVNGELELPEISDEDMKKIMGLSGYSFQILDVERVSKKAEKG